MAGGDLNAVCCPIYRETNDPIKRRTGGEKYLGSKAQFCAAFYHVHEWGERKHSCLHKRKCIIAKRARKGRNYDWSFQPKHVVAVVKFEDSKESTLYEARYTNCDPKKMHAEDFFKKDVTEGDLKKVITDNEGGKITMYLTLQPCNRSVSLAGTDNTRADKTCCDTLLKIYIENLLGRNICLCIKVTHLYRLGLEHGTARNEIEKSRDEQLRQRAAAGITALMLTGVEVESMTEKDWEYLSGMVMFHGDVLTNNNVPEYALSPRRELDGDIENTLTQIREGTSWLKPSLTSLSSWTLAIHSRMKSSE
ncbi:uncharacterized protein LOC114537682 [Dendronephthya gigantea]|uniref:uncharacterized protein LOC114537682 n=1 Tax=Dendronephthya gigantea TaxID=151771 RepID=UPI00106A1B81|nr:uncharacterized protein LOC114537682 [Dendronephthya gigantea]